MIIKIIALLIGLVAVFLTFRVKWVLSAIFRISEPSLETILKVKYVALALAVIAFLAVFLADKL